jgi:hypothetical protein
MHAALGVLAGVLELVGIAPYLAATRRGDTSPHRGTWAIYAAISVLVLSSQRADGASWSLLLIAGQAIGSVAVLALAIRHGTGGRSRGDAAMIALGTLGAVAWLVSAEAVLATLGAILADAVATVLMVPKTYRAPHSESLWAWYVWTVAALAQMGSVATPAFSLLVYPVFIFAANCALLTLLHVRRRAVGEEALA